MKRSLWWTLVLLGFMLINLPEVSVAADFPTKPINLWVGYAPGGETDLSGRAIAESAAKILGQPVVVVNKPGGSGATMLSQLKTAKPDGYTLGTMTMGSLIASHMRKVPYECSKDFTPIIHYGHYAAGFAVRSDSQWKNLEEYLNWAKENPGKAKYSVVGSGSPQHLVMERVAMDRKIKLIHVPYNSGGEAAVAILGGHVTAGSLGGDWIPYVQPDGQPGKLRCLMLTLGKRMKEFPEIPCIREFGFNFEYPNMLGIVGPKGMPEPLVKKLHDGFKAAMDDSFFLTGMRSHHMPVVYYNVEDFGKFIKNADEEQGTLIRNLGLRKE